ncbi:MAG: HAD hydrolase-like protein [Acidimicrobiia bacterium]|nr:HAD hydrolase-like protein [Acidimicrobiia bacterium]
MRHVVWDWNGTLLDDLDVVVESVNAALRSLGADPIDHAVYRRHYTRPVGRFYEALLGRQVDPTEMQSIDDVFHEAYLDGVGGADLAAGAREAIDAVQAAGGTQSIASMLRHDRLVTAVREAGVDDLMLAVDGHRGVGGETKEEHLRHHLAQLRRLYDLDGVGVVLVGDITDDADAAAASGIECVLVDAGSQERATLEAAGVPVVGSLREAVTVAGL